jgi:Protein of unknown function (DUF2914)
LYPTNPLNGSFLRMILLYGFLQLGLWLLPGTSPYGQTDSERQLAASPKLQEAAICEDLKDFLPVNQGVAFSVSAGRVICYTYFNPVPQKTFIYHSWFQKDQLITTKRLHLQPPKWATHSAMQLRVTDKGPWRVEIADQADRVIKVLRFSITD